LGDPALHRQQGAQTLTSSGSSTRSATIFPARKAIVENLIEEELGRVSGANRSHPELYLEFGEAIGIPRAELLSATMTADATAMMHWMYWLAESKPWYVTLAGISLGSELFNTPTLTFA